MGLLFDEIICHSACADMACGGGWGLLGDIWGDQHGELVEAGVIVPDERDLDPNIGYDYYDDNIGTFHRIQVTAIALRTVRKKKAIPVTSDPRWPIPASALTVQDFASDAQGQAVALATECLNLVLPRFAALSDEEILRAREKLSEHLVPFRASMLKLAPALRSSLDSDAGADEVRGEAKYIVDTTVAPLLVEIDRRIQMEKGRFWRRLLMKGTPVLPKFVINWATKGAIAAAIESIPECVGLAMESINREASLDCVMQEGSIGYLLAVSDMVNGTVTEGDK